VNGVKTAAHTLTHGDTLQVGETVPEVPGPPGERR
jgi:hypothetical protein